MITIGNTPRIFIATLDGKKQTLEDPNPNMSPEEVASFYSTRYAELTTANVVGPVMEGDTLKFEFKNVIGTKG